MEESNFISKEIECIIGFLFLIPPLLGVFAFVLCLFGCDWDFARLGNMSSNWTNDYSYNNGGGGMSAVPIYLGLMALAGVWLVRDSIQYLFYKSNKMRKS